MKGCDVPLWAAASSRDVFFLVCVCVQRLTVASAQPSQSPPRKVCVCFLMEPLRKKTNGAKGFGLVVYFDVSLCDYCISHVSCFSSPCLQTVHYYFSTNAFF